MPSVSNVAIGTNMAASAATKARHGMNESIARLSTGIRAMYGGDAAGHSAGTIATAHGKSFAQAARNVEDGISLAQMQESVLLEIANLAQRMRELGIAFDNAGVLDANQEAALTAEVASIGDTIESLVDNTKFNDHAILTNSATQFAIAYDHKTANTTNVGANTAIARTDTIASADGADTSADTILGSVAAALGNVAADLSALKAHQGAASATSANLAAAGARLLDTDFALETASLTKNAILNQAALAMTAQANQAQSAILAVLQ